MTIYGHIPYIKKSQAPCDLKTSWNAEETKVVKQTCNKRHRNYIPARFTSIAPSLLEHCHRKHRAQSFIWNCRPTNQLEELCFYAKCPISADIAVQTHIVSKVSIALSRKQARRHSQEAPVTDR